jgi:hypothetical protein
LKILLLGIGELLADDLSLDEVGSGKGGGILDLPSLLEEEGGGGKIDGRSEGDIGGREEPKPCNGGSEGGGTDERDQLGELLC